MTVQATRRAFLAMLLALVAAPVLAGVPPRTPAAEIEALIQRVAAARGVVFIRNGTGYTAADAAKHLRRKLDASKGRIKTPEAFIDTLGSRSSMSGKPYRVRLPDGRTIDSAAWLNALLADIRAGR
jgi:hypothetical protein